MPLEGASVPLSELAHPGLWKRPSRAILHSYLRDTSMFDELWSEIADSQGEIFDLDIPELKDEKFDVNEYLNGNIDY